MNIWLMRWLAIEEKYNDIYEKITAISNHSNTGMILDFSVLREGDEKQEATM